MTNAQEALTNIEACVFDAYGTLFDVAAAARHCAEDIGEDWVTLSSLWRQKQLEYTWLRSLMGRFTDFWQVTGQALDYAMGSLEMKDDTLRARLMELYLKLDCYPEVPGMLEALRDKGLKTAILSNGSTTMLTSAVRSAELNDLLDDVYSVDRLEIFKPDFRVYQMAVDGLEVAKENIAFLSSNGWDAAGAKAFGFNVLWVNRFGAQPENLDAPPDRILSDLSPLPDLIIPPQPDA